MEERISELEGIVADLRVDNGKLATSVEHLSTNVQELSRVVQDLRDTMNRGRGALWILGTGSAMAGGLIAMIGEWVVRR